MTTHFPTVPVVLVCGEAVREESERLRPLILVVDDEPLIADTMAEILRSNGLAAMTAFDGVTAIELAEVVPPHLLLSDVGMPGMDGVALAIEMTRRIPDCEVILFSGQHSTPELTAMFHAKGRDFLILTKPVHPTEMLARVFERLSLHDWDVPEGFTPRPLG